MKRILTILLLVVASSANAGWISRGTGAAIGNDYFITAYHVVDGGKNTTINGVKAEIIAVDEKNDIAILKARVDTKNHIALTHKPEVTDNVYGCGFSFLDYQTGCTFNKGYINNDGARDGFTSANIDIHPGDSGGAVVDQNGALVGLVDATYMDGKSILVGTQRLVVLEKVLALLATKKISIKSNDGIIHSGKMSDKLIYQLLSDSAVLIVSDIEPPKAGTQDTSKVQITI